VGVRVVLGVGMGRNVESIFIKTMAKIAWNKV